MLRSLYENCPDAYVYVMCMDKKSRDILEACKLSYITCLSLSEVEDAELLAVKKDRGIAEYCWTLSPCLPWHLLEKYPHIDFLTYLDADLFFYSSVEPLFEEIGDASIAIIEHRFSPRLKDREVNGRFCVEWVSFRRDKDGLACLSRWRAQCIEWCFYRLEEGRMGDQKYLDEWPNLYPSCHILMHPGAGIAPWNYEQFFFGEDEMGRLTVEKSLLIFYHFHQFQLLDNGTFDRLSTFYTSECPEPFAIYALYESVLKACLADIKAIAPSFNGGLKRTENIFFRRFIQKYVPGHIKNFIRKYIRL